MPDLYRGRIREGEVDAGRRYADRIGVLLRDMSGLDRRLAAFFVEPLLGCGGQLVLPEGYLQAAFEEVHAAGGVCVCDEVQIGFGRVGSHFWGFETQGVVPDIVTMGKPIGNGHPMGAVACRPEIAAAFMSGMEYFNTFGGNPVSAAAGLAVLDVIRDERLMGNAVARGAQLHDGLSALAERHPLIGDVRGLGLFMGVELVRDLDTLEPADREIKAIVEAMKAEGILLSTEGPHHNVLKIKPPLVISAAECRPLPRHAGWSAGASRLARAMFEFANRGALENRVTLLVWERVLGYTLSRSGAVQGLPEVYRIKNAFSFAAED